MSHQRNREREFETDSYYSLHDEGDLKKYRIELPNLVDDSELSVYAFRLYAHYKRRAGAVAGGVCSEGTRATAAHCKMSVGSVSDAKAELENKGLIYVRRPENGTNQADRITIVDLWAENFAKYAPERQERAPRRPKSPAQNPPETRSPHEQRCSPHERGVHQVNERIEPSEERTREERTLPLTPMCVNSAASAPNSPAQRERENAEIADAGERNSDSVSGAVALSVPAPPGPDNSRNHLNYDHWFEVDFWPLWPVDIGKAAAKAALRTHVRSLQQAEAVIAGLHRWLTSERWTKENRRFVPGVLKWIEAKAWQDYPPPAPSASAVPGRTEAAGSPEVTSGISAVSPDDAAADLARAQATHLDGIPRSLWPGLETRARTSLKLAKPGHDTLCREMRRWFEKDEKRWSWLPNVTDDTESRRICNEAVAALKKRGAGVDDASVREMARAIWEVENPNAAAPWGEVSSRVLSWAEAEDENEADDNADDNLEAIRAAIAAPLKEKQP